MNDLDRSENIKGGHRTSHCSTGDYLTDSEGGCVNIGFVSDGGLRVLTVRVQPATRDGVAVLGGSLLSFPRVHLVGRAISMLVVGISGLLVLMLLAVVAGVLSVLVLGRGLLVAVLACGGLVVTLVLVPVRRSASAGVPGRGVVAVVAAVGGDNGDSQGEGERFHLFVCFKFKLSKF